MTRKDYVAIAGAINSALHSPQAGAKWAATHSAAVALTAQHIAQTLAGAAVGLAAIYALALVLLNLGA